MTNDKRHMSAYQRGYRDGKANYKPSHLNAFRRHDSDYLVNRDYLDGYLRGFAETQVEAVISFNNLGKRA